MLPKQYYSYIDKSPEENFHNYFQEVFRGFYEGFELYETYNKQDMFS